MYRPTLLHRGQRTVQLCARLQPTTLAASHETQASQKETRAVRLDSACLVDAQEGVMQAAADVALRPALCPLQLPRLQPHAHQLYCQNASIHIWRMIGELMCVCIKALLMDALNAFTLTHQVAGCEARHFSAAMPIKDRKYAGVWIAPQPHSGDVRILLHNEVRACMTVYCGRHGRRMSGLSGLYYPASPHRVLLQA